MIVDLSLELREGMPVYPGDPKLEIKTAATLEDEGYLGHNVSIGTHTGTHIDSPAHMLRDGKTLDQFPADTFVGKCRYVPVKDGVFSLEKVQKAGIQPGDIVVFNTGMSKHYNEPDYFKNYPAMNEEIARYLVESKVKMVGVDTCSIDNETDFPVHKILLGNDILIIENLTNLEQLQEREAIIYALPIRLNLDGGPARVIAETSQ